MLNSARAGHLVNLIDNYLMRAIYFQNIFAQFFKNFKIKLCFVLAMTLTAAKTSRTHSDEVSKGLAEAQGDNLAADQGQSLD